MMASRCIVCGREWEQATKATGVFDGVIDVRPAEEIYAADPDAFQWTFPDGAKACICVQVHTEAEILSAWRMFDVRRGGLLR